MDPYEDEAALNASIDDPLKTDSSVIKFAPATPPFPTEIWERIFACLKAPKQLLPIRLVCRHWRSIVDDCPSLINQLTLRFRQDLKFDEQYVPEAPFPARNVRFSNATINNALDSWWPSVGQRLHSLNLQHTTFTLPALVGMLRGTPNLRRCCIVGGRCNRMQDALEELDFRLERLERLTLSWHWHTGSPAIILNVFRQICPRLKHFFYGKPARREDIERALVELIRNVQGTLDTVQLCFLPFGAAVRELGSMDRLRLRRLYLTNRDPVFDQQLLVEFLGMQSTIELLKVAQCPVTNETLCLVGKALPVLKRLEIVIDCQNVNTCLVPSFFNTMPALEHLTLGIANGSNDDAQQVDFSTCRLPNLISLHLPKMRPTSNSLQQLLKGATNLHQLTLGRCHLTSWSEIFTSSQLKFLHTLVLSGTTAGNGDNKVELETLPSIRYFKYSTLQDTDKELLMEVFRLCPKLERISLGGQDIDDEVVRALLHRQIKQLKQITFSMCGIGCETINYIRENCQELRRIEIDHCKKLTDTCVAPLYTMNGVDITFQN